MAKKKKTKRRRPQPAAHRPEPGAQAGNVRASDDMSVMNVKIQDMERRSDYPGADLLRQFAARYANVGPEAVMAAYRKIYSQYNHALVNRGLAMSEEEIKSKDMIDMTALHSRPVNAWDAPGLDFDQEMARDYNTFMNDPQAGFYRALPCFDEAVLKLNTGRFVYFKVESVDFESESYRIYLRDYILREALWQPGTCGEATIAREPNKTQFTLQSGTDDALLFDQIYRQIPLNQFDWTRMERSLWRDVIIKNAEAVRDMLAGKQTNNLVELGRLFMRYITVMNFFMERYRPKLAPGQKRKPPAPDMKSNRSNKSNHEPNKNDTGTDAPERLVRTIGMIRVISASAPRRTTSKSFRYYRVESWTARGHVRKYKSGKTVYIRPTVHHRKALAGNKSGPPQSVVVLKGSLPGKDGDGT